MPNTISNFHRMPKRNPRRVLADASVVTPAPMVSLLVATAMKLVRARGRVPRGEASESQRELVGDVAAQRSHPLAPQRASTGDVGIGPGPAEYPQITDDRGVTPRRGGLSGVGQHKVRRIAEGECPEAGEGAGTVAVADLCEQFGGGCPTVDGGGSSEATVAIAEFGGGTSGAEGLIGLDARCLDGELDGPR